MAAKSRKNRKKDNPLNECLFARFVPFCGYRILFICDHLRNLRIMFSVKPV
jgi:hypothetical protein